MAIAIDENVQMVLEFMERNIEADKLVRVATAVASLAPALWADQQRLQRDRLVTFTAESCREQLATATQLAAAGCADGGSAEAMDTQKPM